MKNNKYKKSDEINEKWIIGTEIKKMVNIWKMI